MKLPYGTLRERQAQCQDATSLQEAAPTTRLSTSQSNAAHRIKLDNLFLGNP
ncbi:hypothetical protein [Nostoc sp. NMS9]|uniref:hypothetical protein n=1 Tax=Nostoc sp. NMS9 TaxID=2815393 RepID=UPI0025F7617A|nr:hypothetical protein [Nostoc sp. NMS9]MBN3939892.1 hypothetical protein [Nostoc sp. NMS9]